MNAKPTSKTADTPKLTVKCSSDTIIGGINIVADEGCDELFLGGGILKPPPVLPGDCILVRVGGYAASKGRGLLTVGCIESDCPPSLSVVKGVSKVRHLALSFPTPGVKAIRVVFGSLPPPFDIASGAVMWITSPVEVCENSGQNSSVLPENCGPTLGSDPEMPGPTMFIAGLTCDPVYLDWSSFPEFNVTTPFIVPGRSYTVQVVDEGCPFTLESSFSDPVVIQTSAWGDLIGTCSPEGLCTPPDGVVGITTDVSSILEMFKNSIFAPGKTKADIEPGSLDQIINFTDVVECLSAFSSGLYPFAAPDAPCGTASSGSK